MTRPMEQKSSIQEIKERFDNDVERFSNLNTGQQAIMDAPLVMDLIARSACQATTQIQHVLDIGCGAGNNSIKLSEYVNPFNYDLVDLSMPMLNRAQERISAVNGGKGRIFQGDFGDMGLPEGYYDVVLAAAVLHHLREESDWECVFQKIHDLTAPGGSVWITDLVSHEAGSVQTLMWEQYGQYLDSLGGKAYRAKVFDCIDQEDSPRPVTYQLELLRKVGFDRVDLLHKNACFAAFGALKTTGLS